VSDDWRPTAPPGALRARAAMLARIRAHFAAAGVLEVETPTLSRGAVTDVHLASVPAEVAGLGRMYLHTSPEYAMKRLLAAGIGDCYQVCRVYRDGEAGRWHNPEFTLVEWYRVGLDAAALMDDVEALVRHALAPHRELAPFERVTYREAVRRHGGVDPLAARPEDVAAALARHGVEAPRAELDELLDLLVSAVVGPALGRDGGAFVCDYPASQAALARLKPADPTVAERFELYLDGIELANGFHELADAREQRARFAADLAERARRGLPAPPVDERFLSALAAGIPDCSGVALGFDRLVMVALGLDSLAGAMAFPADRA
jgi:lysyl-tRNA synthetase class 2